MRMESGGSEGRKNYVNLPMKRSAKLIKNHWLKYRRWFLVLVLILNVVAFVSILSQFVRVKVELVENELLSEVIASGEATASDLEVKAVASERTWGKPDAKRKSKYVPRRGPLPPRSPVQPADVIPTTPITEEFDVEGLMEVRYFTTRTFLIEDPKVLYCPIPKVACTNWKTQIRRLMGYRDWKNVLLAHRTGHNGVPLLSDYATNTVREVLTDPDLLKFTITRNPYSRLLSAYMDKLESRDVTDPDFRRSFKNAFGKRRKVFKPSFQQFVDHVVQQEYNDMDGHWSPQLHQCRHDIMQYDYYIRFEDLDFGTAKVMRALGYPEELPQSAATNNHATNSTTKVQQMYNAALAEKVYNKFKMDFEALNYSKDINQLEPIS